MKMVRECVLRRKETEPVRIVKGIYVEGNM